jgi:hypothetical protein
MSAFRDIDPISLWTIGIFLVGVVMLGFTFLR